MMKERLVLIVLAASLCAVCQACRYAGRTRQLASFRPPTTGIWVIALTVAPADDEDSVKVQFYTHDTNIFNAYVDAHYDGGFDVAIPLHYMETLYVDYAGRFNMSYNDWSGYNVSDSEVFLYAKCDGFTTSRPIDQFYYMENVPFHHILNEDLQFQDYHYDVFHISTTAIYWIMMGADCEVGKWARIGAFIGDRNLFYADCNDREAMVTSAAACLQAFSMLEVRYMRGNSSLEGATYLSIARLDNNVPMRLSNNSHIAFSGYLDRPGRYDPSGDNLRFSYNPFCDFGNVWYRYSWIGVPEEGTYLMSLRVVPAEGYGDTVIHVRQSSKSSPLWKIRIKEGFACGQSRALDLPWGETMWITNQGPNPYLLTRSLFSFAFVGWNENWREQHRYRNIYVP